VPHNDFYLSLPFRMRAQLGFRAAVGNDDLEDEAIADAEAFIKYRDGQATSARSVHVQKIQKPAEQMLEYYDLTIETCLITATKENYFRSRIGGVRKELEILMANADNHQFDDPILYFVFESGNVGDRRLKKLELIMSYRSGGFSTGRHVGSYKLKVYHTKD